MAVKRASQAHTHGIQNYRERGFRAQAEEEVHLKNGCKTKGGLRLKRIVTIRLPTQRIPWNVTASEIAENTTSTSVVVSPWGVQVIQQQPRNKMSRGLLSEEQHVGLMSDIGHVMEAETTRT